MGQGGIVQGVVKYEDVILVLCTPSWCTNSSPLFSSDLSFFAIQSMLQEIITALFWVPSARLGADDAVHCVGTESSPSYLSELFQRAKKCIVALDKAITEHCTQADVFDKPTATRFWNVCSNGDPTFGHALLFTQMPLKLAHRQFKK